jgi:hypothetical protein
MFKVKNRKTQEIVQVLNVYLDEIYGITYFLIWENNSWRWRLADNYVPPNWEENK